MDRVFAIANVVRFQLKQLTAAQRQELLESVMGEDWTDEPAWAKLSLDVIDELEELQIRHDAADSRYDPVLQMVMRYDFRGATNEYLRSQLKQNGIFDEQIIGAPDELVSCPCCGRKSLTERNGWDICRVCWWEDDGQDNHNAHVATGGPNYGISLAQARYNVLVYGIYDPERTDLISKQTPKDMFAVGRVFEIASHSMVTEPAVGESWCIVPIDD